MPRKSRQISVDRARANNYILVAENFDDGANVAEKYEYWNAAGVSIVHAAIAYGDAVTIKFGGIKSKGEDHQALVSLIDSLIPESADKKKAILQLNKIITHKNSVSYSGDIYGPKDIEQLRKLLDRFSSWVKSVID